MHLIETRFRFIMLLALLVLALFTFSACESSDFSGQFRKEGLTPEERRFNDLVSASSAFVNTTTEVSVPIRKQRQNRQDLIKLEKKVDGRVEMVNYKCQEWRVVEYAPGFSELSLVGSSDVIYPGAVFYGDSIINGVYRPITEKRKPINVSISILGVEMIAAARVEKPSLSTFRTASLAFLTRMNLGSVRPPANQTFSVSSLHHRSQLASSFAVGIKAQRSPENVLGRNTGGSAFDWVGNVVNNNIDDRQRYFARFTHRYFTIDVDIPSHPSDFFEEFPNIGSSSPVYVSSVVYGRQLSFNINSHRRTHTIQSALGASVVAINQNEGSPDNSLEGKLDEKSTTTIINSDFEGIVRGGSQSACGAIASQERGSDQIKEFERCLREGGNNYQDAVPIAYVLRHLNSNTTARVVFPKTNYPITECRESGRKAGENWLVTRMRSSNNDTNVFDRALEISGELNIEPSDASPGSSGGCDIYKADGITPRSSSSRTQRIINFAHINKIGGGWRNIVVKNYRASLTRDNAQNSLVLCGQFVEHQGSKRRPFSHRQIISSGDSKLMSSDGLTIRFGRGRFWLEFSFRRMEN